MHFFALATFSFFAAMAASPWVIGQAIVYFYQPAVLALVHTLTLGWITSAIMGVMYRYVPSLTHRPLPFPRIAFAQFVLFLIGVSGMVTHFALGSWVGVWSAAIVVLISAAMFAANMLVCLWRQFGRGATETGMFLATCFLLVAASLGFLLAFDKSFNFLRGDVITNLAAHVDLAALGWVTLAICAVSYRMLPAFTVPTASSPRNALFQLYALAATVSALAFILLADLPGATVTASAIVATLLLYIVSVARIVRSRRRPIDWTVRHVVVGMVSLGTAAGLGLALTRAGTQDETGARIAALYGLFGLMGFFGNLIIGMSYRLFAGFVERVRAVRGWRAIPATTLAFAGPRALVFFGFNVGLVIVAGGVILANGAIARTGATLMAVSALVYTLGTLRTLAFAYLPRSGA